MPNEFDKLKVENQPVRLAQGCLGAGEFLASFHQDAAVLVDRPFEEAVNSRVYSPETVELGQKLNLAQNQADRWLRGVVGVDPNTNRMMIRQNNGVSLYHNFLRSLASTQTPEVITESMHNFVERMPSHADFMESLMKRQPLVASASIYLYASVLNGLRATEGSENQWVGRKLFWYKEVMDNAVLAHQSTGEFFGKMQERAKRARVSKMTGQFLDDLSSDVDLQTVEVLNWANVLAINAMQGADCGMFFWAVPFNMKANDYEYARQRIYGLRSYELEDGREPIYSRFSSGLFERMSGSNSTHGILYVPTYASFIDSLRYMENWRGFWESANKGLSAKGVHRERYSAKEGTFYIDLGGEASMMVRPVALSQNGGARIAFLGRKEFDGFNVRVDQERDKLTMDVGHVDFGEAISYAEEVARFDRARDLLEGYEEVVDELGRVKEDRIVYPSIMDSRAFNLSQRSDVLMSKTAMVASLVAGQGDEVGLRLGEEYFAYHLREKISAQSAYAVNFVPMALQIYQSLTR